MEQRRQKNQEKESTNKPNVETDRVNGSQTNRSVRSVKNENKISRTIKNIGKGRRSSDTDLFAYGAYQKNVVKRKKPRGRDLFMLASENYRRSVNPTMTNKQLAMQMEAIRNSSFKDLTDGRDIVYKTWIMDAEKRFAAEGERDPIQAMKDSIIKKDKNRA